MGRTFACGRTFESIQIRHGARSRPAWVATRTASSGGGRRFSRRASCRHRKNRKLRSQMLALALGTGCLLAPENQSFKPMLTLGANVFKYRHDLPFARYPTEYTRSGSFSQLAVTLISVVRSIGQCGRRGDRGEGFHRRASRRGICGYQTWGPIPSGRVREVRGF